MVGVHRSLGVALLVVVSVGALWALAAALRGGATAALRSYARLCVLALGVQVLIGIALVATGHRPASALHWVYGGVVLVCIPVGVAMSAAREPRREALALGLGLLVAALIAARAVMTGA